MTSSPIDDCSTSDLDVACDSDPDSGRTDNVRGCSSRAVVSGEPLLVNTNQTSLVGLDAYIRSECACAARSFTDVTVNARCRADSCLNGGTCYELEYSVTLVIFIYSLSPLVLVMIFCETRKPSYYTKVSARQPWYIGRNSLNRPPLRIAQQYQRNLYIVEKYLQCASIMPSLRVRVYLHSFICCCLPNMRTSA